MFLEFILYSRMNVFVCVCVCVCACAVMCLNVPRGFILCHQASDRLGRLWAMRSPTYTLIRLPPSPKCAYWQKELDKVTECYHDNQTRKLQGFKEISSHPPA